MALIDQALEDTERNRIHRLLPGVTVRIVTSAPDRTGAHVGYTHDHRTSRDNEELLFTVPSSPRTVAFIVGSNEGSFAIDATRNQNRRPGWTPEIAEAELASRYTDEIKSGPYPTRP